MTYTQDEPDGRVAIVGLGRTGAELALALAATGARVVGIEADTARAAVRHAALLRALDATVVRGERSAVEITAIRGRLTVSATLADAAGCDLIVEAVPEQLVLKQQVLRQLAAVCTADAVLAVTAIALPVAEVVTGTGWERRSCGVRYTGLLAGTKLVELVRPPDVKEVAAERVAGLLRALGKRMRTSDERVDAAPAAPPALLFGLLNAAVLMHDHGYATAGDIDAAMRLGCGWSTGPLEMLDTIGLDTALDVLRVLHDRTARRGYAPAPLLRRMVSAGMLGRKAGRGFYSYERGGTRAPISAADATDDGTTAARPIRQVGVVGTGIMATGIAAALVTSGVSTVLVGRNASRARAARESVLELVERSEGAGSGCWLLTCSDSLRDLASCDFVIEAVAEDLTVKRERLAGIDAVCRPGTVLATTTSGLPVVDCATATSRPGDVIGLHFFNPVLAMPLVELVTTALTSTTATSTARALCDRLGKQVIACEDRAGFIVNRLLFPMVNNAVAAASAGEIECDALDAVLRSGIGLPMGPIRLLDVVGADVALSVQESLFRESGDPELAPAPVLHDLVTTGHLGRKVQRSVREYPSLGRFPVPV